MRTQTMTMGGRKVTRDTWESWLDFVDDAASLPSKMADGERESRIGDRDFTGTDTFAEAQTLAVRGWHEGAKKIAPYADALFSRLSSLVETERYLYADDGGLYVDVGRAMEGESEYWLASEPIIREGTGRRIIRLVMNTSVSGGIRKDVIIARGAVMAALVMLLERAGHGVEVTATSASEDLHGHGMQYEAEVLVKAADQSIDVLTLAYALAHPSTLRRLVFAIKETQSYEMRRAFGVEHNGGYGRPSEATDRGDIYCGSAHLDSVQWGNSDAAIAFIIKALREQGVKVD